MEIKLLKTENLINMSTLSISFYIFSYNRFNCEEKIFIRLIILLL